MMKACGVILQIHKVAHRYFKKITDMDKLQSLGIFLV